MFGSGSRPYARLIDLMIWETEAAIIFFPGKRRSLTRTPKNLGVINWGLDFFHLFHFNFFRAKSQEEASPEKPGKTVAEHPATV